MRGKAKCQLDNVRCGRITPAYAGKRPRAAQRWTTFRDHPRVCGEKLRTGERKGCEGGSPPRMRGKGRHENVSVRSTRITPAYAGKSIQSSRKDGHIWDHPRVCGEKSALPNGTRSASRITPAYAGKSIIIRYIKVHPWDHPRVCGEKKKGGSPEKSGLGSPPRMRGKGSFGHPLASNSRITPAYAGKRLR